MLVAGIMSGTSVDGIDVALVEITGRGGGRRVRAVGFGSVPFSAPVRKAILAASNAEVHVAHLARLHSRLGELYADAVKAVCRQCHVKLASLDLIGCHGQTIFHDGVGTRFLGRRIATTLQIGDADRLAEQTGVPVVSDFRMRDMAAGGRGRRSSPTSTISFSATSASDGWPSTSAASQTSRRSRRTVRPKM